MNGDGARERRIARAKELQAMAQTGLTYAHDPYDRARYERLTALACEMLADDAATDVASVATLFAHERGHATPKLDVRAAVFDGDRLLLVRERSDGRWTLPGGWADPGETPAVAARRETREESGFDVRVTRLLAAWEKGAHAHPPSPFYVVKLVYDAVVTGGAATTSDETDAVEFFEPDALPPLSLGRILPDQIAKLVALHRDPAAATDFD